VEFGTFNYQETAILVNDIHELEHGRVEKLHLLEFYDLPFIHLFRGFRKMRDVLYDIGSIQDLIRSREKGETIRQQQNQNQENIEQDIMQEMSDGIVGASFNNNMHFPQPNPPHYQPLHQQHHHHLSHLSHYNPPLDAMKKNRFLSYPNISPFINPFKSSTPFPSSSDQDVIQPLSETPSNLTPSNPFETDLPVKHRKHNEGRREFRPDVKIIDSTLRNISSFHKEFLKLPPQQEEESVPLEDSVADLIDKVEKEEEITNLQEVKVASTLLCLTTNSELENLEDKKVFGYFLFYCSVVL